MLLIKITTFYKKIDRLSHGFDFANAKSLK